MELRSNGNQDTSNPVTMSMLEHLRKKGIEAMSGTCKYPESVCPHMTVLRGKSYCDSTPCQLTGELPKQSNGDRIRGMSDKELAHFISVQFCHGYGEPQTLEWLKQPVED